MKPIQLTTAGPSMAIILTVIALSVLAALTLASRWIVAERIQFLVERDALTAERLRGIDLSSSYSLFMKRTDICAGAQRSLPQANAKLVSLIENLDANEATLRDLKIEEVSDLVVKQLGAFEKIKVLLGLPTTGLAQLIKSYEKALHLFGPSNLDCGVRSALGGE